MRALMRLFLISVVVMVGVMGVVNEAKARRAMPMTTPEQALKITKTWLASGEGVTWTLDSPRDLGWMAGRYATDGSGAPDDPDTRLIYKDSVATLELHFVIPLGPKDSLAAARERVSHATLKRLSLDGLFWVRPWNVFLSEVTIPKEQITVESFGEGRLTVHLTGAGQKVVGENHHCEPDKRVATNPTCGFALDINVPIDVKVSAPVFAVLPK
jgi:hypothetical protein